MFYKIKQELLDEKCITYDQMQILIDFQKLWFKIAIWVRIYIRAAIYNTPNKEPVANYLLELPFEAYSIFSRYYSPNVAERIKELLLAFIEAIMGTIEAMRYGDEMLINSRITKWYQSADKLASYLASINEYWDEEKWKNLFYKYISIKIDEVNAVINDNYEEEKRLFKMIKDIDFLMAQYMAEGIIYLIDYRDKINQKSQNEECFTYNQIKLLFEFQNLWLTFVVLVRTYMVATIYNTPNKKAVSNYLLELPDEIYSIFSRYFSIKEAETIKQLFLDFIEATIETIEAMKCNDEVQINSSIIRWYKNADKISSYLASINEYWDEDEWKNLLYQYINLEIDEINAVINQDYEEEMRLYNMIEDVNFLMIEYMTEGILYLIRNRAQM